MARYKGPRVRIGRRFGLPVFGPSKYLERRAYPPGVHGPKSRRKHSDYGEHLLAKQILRYQYGLLERQFRRMFEVARKRRGNTGETLMQMLETRLDNVVYKLGWAGTRSGARQIVNHGHVRVNGRKVNVPSYSVVPGNVIEVREKAASRQLVIKNGESGQVRSVPSWLSLDRDSQRAQMMRLPTRDEIAPLVNEQLIVEFYSR